MRDVSVIGVGMSKFGKLEGKGIREIGEEACWNAIKDAGIGLRDVQAAYCGSALTGLASGQDCINGQIVLRQVGITGIPVTNVGNICASSSCAFREAWMAVALGLYDTAIALGVEKQTAIPTLKLLERYMAAMDRELEGNLGLSMPAWFAMIANRHMQKFGTTSEQLAKVSVKNHKNGTKNPYAHFQKEITVDDVLNSRMVAYPLRLFDCCPISDGAAAAILTTKESARKLTDTPIHVVASSQTSGSYAEDSDITTCDLDVRASRRAYKMAGVKPKDLDFAEVHDCFTIAEILHYEDLGFCQKGEGGKLIDEGQTEIGGNIPINPSGGLISRGHPNSATGIAQICEIVWQLRGEAGKRQIDNAETALTHTVGGFMHADMCSSAIHIFRK